MGCYFPLTQGGSSRIDTDSGAKDTITFPIAFPSIEPYTFGFDIGSDNTVAAPIITMIVTNSTAQFGSTRNIYGYRWLAFGW